MRRIFLLGLVLMTILTSLSGCYYWGHHDRDRDYRHHPDGTYDRSRQDDRHDRYYHLR